jgi:hypothetical protein
METTPQQPEATRVPSQTARRTDSIHLNTRKRQKPKADVANVHVAQLALPPLRAAQPLPAPTPSRPVIVRTGVAGIPAPDRPMKGAAEPTRDQLFPPRGLTIRPERERPQKTLVGALRVRGGDDGIARM